MKVEGRGIWLDFTVDTPDGEKTYSVPAAGVAEGMRIAEIHALPEDQRAKEAPPLVDWFRLALGDVWDQMVADRVPYSDAYLVGMAAHAREFALLSDTGPDRWANAAKAAQAYVEAGVDPEALAAWTAANSGTGSMNRATRRAAARTTRRPGSGTGTSGKKPRTIRR